MKKFTSIILCFTTVFVLYQNSASAQWNAKGENLQFAQGRWGGMCFTLNNKIYLTGGYSNTSYQNDVQVYDPVAGKWAYKKAPTGPANRSSGVAFTINGKSYVGLGAENFISTTGTEKKLADLLEYNEASDSWTAKASLPEGGRTEACVFVANNKAYVVGGSTNNTGSAISNQVWEFDPAANKWTKKADFPVSISQTFAFGINGKGYVTGGVAGTTATKKTYEYDPAANKWTEKADFIDTARYGGVAFVVNNKGYIGLGRAEGSSHYSQTFYEYDPATDKWKYVFAKWPAQGRMYGVAAAIGGKAYVGAGWKYVSGVQTYFRDWYEGDITAALGISDNNATTHTLQVYPNPTNGAITVQLPDAGKTYNYTVTSIAGQVVASGVVPADGKLNFSQLSPAQYILQLSSGTEVAKTVMHINP